MSSDTMVFVVVIVLRLAIPLLIPRFPLPAILAALVLDAADQTIFQQFTDRELTGYQTYDKALDVYYLAVAYISTMRNWGGGFAFRTAQFLWYYRLVGVLLFESTQARWLLLVFPNTFEYFFIAVEAYKTSRNHLRLTQRQIVLIAGSIWVFIKLPQETWIHIAKLDFTNFMKHTVFGMPEPVDDTPWGEAIGNRPLVAVALVVLILGLLALIRVLLRRLPPRDWRRTLDADVQGRHLGWGAPSPITLPSATFSRPLLEKAALLAMVLVIFANILPDVDPDPVVVVVGALAVLLGNTVVAEFLARRSTAWRSPTTKFATMAPINAGLTVVFLVLLPGPSHDLLPLGDLLFLAALFTVLSVLFDRYRHIGEEHRALLAAAHPAATTGQRPDDPRSAD